MYKFSGWMLRTATWFDRQTVQAWLGTKVTATKYFLGIAPGTTGTVLGVFESAPDQLLLVVEWEVKEQAARRLDLFSQTEAERYLQRLSPFPQEHAFAAPPQPRRRDGENNSGGGQGQALPL